MVHFRGATPASAPLIPLREQPKFALLISVVKDYRFRYGNGDD
jgi:hypothetical protein